MTQIENSRPDLDKAPKPDPFRLRAQLVDEGSKSWVLGETESMPITIRTTVSLFYKAQPGFMAPRVTPGIWAGTKG